MVQKIILLILMILVSQPILAQDGGNEPNVVSKYGPRRQIATIVYMGLGGAVLGLSTLSFYGRPQDKLSNIPIGFGIGVIIGTVYMTYQAATNPQEFYKPAQLDYQPNWNKEYEVSSAADLFTSKHQPSISHAWSF